MVDAGDGKDQVEAAMVGLLLLGQQGAGQGERPQQELEQVGGDQEAAEEADHQGHRADDQAGAQLDQVIQERRAGGLDLGVVVGDAQGPVSVGGVASSALGLALDLRLAFGLAAGSASASD